MDCVETHQKVAGSDECTARADVTFCRPGYFSPRGEGGICRACEQGEYADGTKERYGCEQCPNTEDGRSQTSAAASTLTGCTLRFHAMDSRTCSGIGLDGRNSTLTRVTTVQECQAFADDSPMLTFNSTNELCIDPSDCGSNISPTACEKLVLGTNITEHCRAMCNNCGKPDVPCIVDEDGTTVRFYDDGTTARYRPFTYRSACSTFNCERIDFDVTTHATATADPICTVSEERLGQFTDEEDAAQLLFFYVSGPLLFLLVPLVGYVVILVMRPDGWIDAKTGKPLGWLQDDGTVYMSSSKWNWWTTFRKLPWSLHQFVWFGLTLRLTDMTTDWAFWRINIGMPGEENSFFFKYDADVEAVQTLSLVFIVFGTLLTPFDVWGSLERCKKKNVGVRLVFSVAIGLLEDIPQMSVNGIYIDACGLGSGTGEAVTVVSLLFSGIAMGYSWFSIFKDFTTLRQQRNKNQKPKTKAVLNFATNQYQPVGETASGSTGTQNPKAEQGGLLGSLADVTFNPLFSREIQAQDTATESDMQDATSTDHKLQTSNSITSIASADSCPNSGTVDNNTAAACATEPDRRHRQSAVNTHTTPTAACLSGFGFDPEPDEVLQLASAQEEGQIDDLDELMRRMNPATASSSADSNPAAACLSGFGFDPEPDEVLQLESAPKDPEGQIDNPDDLLRLMTLATKQQVPSLAVTVEFATFSTAGLEL